MNIATLQLATSGQQPLGKSMSTSTSADFSQTLASATTDEQVEEAVANNSDSNGRNSKGVQLELGLNGLLPTSQVKEEQEAVDVASILGATTLADLPIELSETQLVSGQLSLTDLAKIIGTDEETLLKSLSELTGQEITTTNVWDVLNTIDANLFGFMQNLSQSLEGKGTLSKQDASNVATLLKVIELASPKTDLTLQQEMQVNQLKDVLTTVASKVSETTQTQKEARTFVTQMSQTSKVDVLTTKASTQQVVAEQEPVGLISSTPSSPQTTNATMTLPKAVPASQAESFIKQFEQIMSRSQFSNNMHGQRLLIKLYPEHLGSIRIEFTQKDGMMTAKILTSTAAGKQMLESQLTQLKSGFANQNIQMDRVDISQALSEPSKSDKGNQFNQHSSSSQQQKEQETKEDEDMKTFEQLLAEIEV
ncbi:flagellar hook-length control protein FliK [Kurthia senegalensis]|uniref:flagellar hook-length control protein FliK n=1 Tax=Kurthia senegalensis TaxID=1033740 RepID=UPI000289AEA1|nr:flagellar hook-length control protein FliK [Kurthia senegalensis]